MSYSRLPMWAAAHSASMYLRMLSSSAGGWYSWSWIFRVISSISTSKYFARGVWFCKTARPYGSFSNPIPFKFLFRYGWGWLFFDRMQKSKPLLQSLTKDSLSPSTREPLLHIIIIPCPRHLPPGIRFIHSTVSNPGHSSFTKRPAWGVLQARIITGCEGEP